MLKEAVWQDRRSGSEKERPQDPRSRYERDRSRVIHSAAFRRLQSKTQVLGIREGDFHRTRLTHTMEVAQIARGIVLRLRQIQPDLWKDDEESVIPDLPLIETICFCHDLGHPPFGHSGERALNYVMREHGGFEGNGHSLRLIARLESRKSGYGLDLTRRAILGILKYPAPYSEAINPNQCEPYPPVAPGLKPPKCFLDTEKQVFTWLLEPLSDADRGVLTGDDRWSRLPGSEKKHGSTKYKTIDCSIMEVADDIAYGVHDLEDAIVLGLVTKSELMNRIDKNNNYFMYKSDTDRSIYSILEQLFSDDGNNRKEAVGALVNEIISNVFIYCHEHMESDIFKYRCVIKEESKELLTILKVVARENVIERQQTQTLEHRGRLMIKRLFKAFESDPEKLLSASAKKKYMEASNEDNRKRVICDYIAGMTDEYATRMYERLFVPREGTVFDRL